MKKVIKFKTRGYRSSVGDVSIIRLMPNQHTYHIGHFVFLDYVPPAIKHTKMVANVGGGHLHRGIATLTYVLSGEAEHYESR